MVELDYLRLGLGLTLPWVAGSAWLAAIDNIFSSAPPNRFRQLGYGLFLGYAGLQGLLHGYTSLVGQIDFWPILGLLVLISMAGIGAMIVARPAALPNQPMKSTNRGPASVAGKILLVVLLGWTGLHLSLATIELHNQPVFPWDAWLAWIYRAKAWFYSNNIYHLASPQEWLLGSSDAAYSIAAAGYPTFASVVPLWAVISLGSWSETLVSTPVILCGIALGLALYGQCRELGLSILLSVVAGYLLISIPLVGTHLSLAGYADIWMAGFSGLGMVALLRGLYRNDRSQLITAYLFLGLGLLVKNEGIVWLYVAAATHLLTRLSLRATTTVAAVVIAVSIAAAISGIISIELPLLGSIGIIDGQILLPFAGTHLLQVHDVKSAYLTSVFVHGSWNILGALLIAAIPLVYFARDAQLKKIAVAFALMFVSSQVVIFSLTEQGEWAHSFTAINRLPMQLSPALLLIVLVSWGQFHKYLSVSRSAPEADRKFFANRRLSVLTGSALIGIAFVSTLYFAYRELATSSFEFPPQQLTFAVGSGSSKTGAVTIDSFHQGIAIISSGPVQIDAQSVSVLSYDSPFGNRAKPVFYWRLQNAPEDIKTTDIIGPASGSMLLSQLDDWRGNITEVGYIFYEDESARAVSRGFQLQPNNLATKLKLIWSDWTYLSPWSQKSINWVLGGRQGQIASLTAVLSALLIIPTLLLTLMYGFGARSYSTYSAMGIFALLLWIAGDIKWTLHQAYAAGSAMGGSATDDCIATGLDCEIKATADFIQTVLDPAGTTKILIVDPEGGAGFNALRMKYHLLPLAASIGYSSAIHNRNDINHLLLIKPTVDPQQTGEADPENSKFEPYRQMSNSQLIWQNSRAALFAIETDMGGQQ